MKSWSKTPHVSCWAVVLLVVVGAAGPLAGQENRAAARRNRGARAYPPQLADAKTEAYRTVDGVELLAYRYEPADHEPGAKAPAVLFFFGGGWRSGSPKQFEEHCKLLARHGIVGITCDYRVASRHGVKAKSCVEDAKAAVRWARTHADRLGIDPERIVAAGGSAGGHLAACTGLVPGFEEDSKVSSVPNALMLFNPAVVLSAVPGEYDVSAERLKQWAERTGVEPEQISPYHHVKRGAPPTILFHGTKDTAVPFETVELFTEKMTEMGNRCELKAYPGAAHGFFNHGRGDNAAYEKTTQQMLEFLRSLGYLDS